MCFRTLKSWRGVSMEANTAMMMAAVIPPDIIKQFTVRTALR